jgi:uncharacterized protein (UPF0212 family)
MNRIITFDLSEGGTVLLETRDLTPPSQVTRGIASDVVVKAAHSFEDAIAVVQPVASSLVKRLKEATEGLDSIDIKFGLKFSAEAGAIIASASTEANIEVCVGWRRPLKA